MRIKKVLDTKELTYITEMFFYKAGSLCKHNEMALVPENRHLFILFMNYSSMLLYILFVYQLLLFVHNMTKVCTANVRDNCIFNIFYVLDIMLLNVVTKALFCRRLFMFKKSNRILEAIYCVRYKHDFSIAVIQRNFLNHG